MMKDLGYQLSGEIWGDASVALGVIHRNGLGKTRHIDTGLFWLQETAASNRLTYFKVFGKDNPADLFTKYLNTATADHHVDNLSFKYTHGRATVALKLHGLSRSLDEYMNGDNLEEWQYLKLLRPKVKREDDEGNAKMLTSVRWCSGRAAPREWRSGPAACNGPDVNVSRVVGVAGVHAKVCRGYNAFVSTPHLRPCGARPTGHGYGFRAPTRLRGSDCRAMIQLPCGRRQQLTDNTLLLLQRTAGLNRNEARCRAISPHQLEQGLCGKWELSAGPSRPTSSSQECAVKEVTSKLDGGEHIVGSSRPSVRKGVPATKQSFPCEEPARRALLHFPRSRQQRKRDTPSECERWLGPTQGTEQRGVAESRTNAYILLGKETLLIIPWLQQAQPFQFGGDKFRALMRNRT